MTSPRPRLRPAQAAAMRHHRPRLYDAAPAPAGPLDGGPLPSILATARVVGYYSGRSRRVVERHCTPVACDVASGLALYDLDAAVAALAGVRRQSPASDTRRNGP